MVILTFEFELKSETDLKTAVSAEPRLDLTLKKDNVLI